MAGFFVNLKRTNKRALMANLYARDKAIQRDVRKAVKAVAIIVGGRTFRRGAKDTYFMVEHIVTDVKELTYTVGWYAKDFIGAHNGRRIIKEFYPPYVEFGTRSQSPQPALVPSSKEGDKMLADRVKAIINKHLSRRAPPGAKE